MSDVQIESDPLFQLLTDALRAGPQSAEWSQAVARVREGGASEADEYALLLRAREDLESGKEYKSVRAGAGFTRNLFGKIDEEKDAAKAKGLPTANLLAIGAGVVLLGVIAVVAFLVSRGGGGGGNANEETLPALFPTSLVSSTFAPEDKGLTLSGDAAGGIHVGGAATVAQPITGRFEIEADVQAPPGGAENALVQVVVPGGGDTTRMAQETGRPRWQLFGRNQRVLVGDVTKTIAPVPADGKVTVRMVMGKSTVAVYANKQLLWSGPHGLPEGPRSPRVEILPAQQGATTTPATTPAAMPVVTAVRVRGESKP